MAVYPRASESNEPLLLLDGIGAENGAVFQTQTELMEGAANSSCGL